MNRGSRTRPSALGLSLLACSLFAGTAGISLARAETTPTDSGAAPTLFGDTRLRTSDYCTALATSPWPLTAASRRTLLHRFEAVRTACIAHAPFLAMLGALWLEEGEPDQALLWLERSLMLEPEQLGAQADHALALAALGEPAARISLAEGAGGRAAKERHSYRLRASFARSIRHRFSAETSVFSGPDPGIPQPVKTAASQRMDAMEKARRGPDRKR